MCWKISTVATAQRGKYPLKGRLFPVYLLLWGSKRLTASAALIENARPHMPGK
jgi:hypothetical protein